MLLSDNAFKGTVVNRALTSLHGGSLKINPSNERHMDNWLIPGSHNKSFDLKSDFKGRPTSK